MGWTYEIPGDEILELDHVVLDVNGTLTESGKLISGVTKRIRRLRGDLEVHLLSADTFGTLGSLVTELGVEGQRIAMGAEKRDFVKRLGADRCVAIGNGRNDVEMLEAVRLGICVIGPEGTSRAAIDVADIVSPSIRSALDLLLNPRVLSATLRH